MENQIQIISTEKDNIEFENYLITSFHCVLYQSFAPIKEELVITHLNDTYYPYNSILIHNTLFDWTPEYKQTNNEKKDFYISNGFGAPLVSFSKTNWEHNITGFLSRQDGFIGSKANYDRETFTRFFEDLGQWFKENAASTEKQGSGIVYYMKNAREKYRN